ncbi:MAG: hypothetical protein ACREOO_30340 [bacterium]
MKKLASSNSDRHFDALRITDSAGSWSPDSRKLAVVVFAEGDNEIAILDVASRKTERQIAVEDVGAIFILFPIVAVIVTFIVCTRHR